MTDAEKIEVIADILEVDINDVDKNMELVSFETWDSVAVLSLISFLNDEFDKFPHAKEIEEYKTVADLMNAMQI